MSTSTGRQSKPRVLLVGWESASLRLLRKLSETGATPATESMLESGVSGMLRPTAPRVRAALWASLTTGRPPHRHGVLHSQELAADGRSVAAVSSRSRRAPSLAQLLGDACLRVHQVGGATTSPAAPVSGVCVGDRFASHGEQGAVDATGAPPWMSQEAVVQELAARLRSPADVQPMSLTQFLPERVLASVQPGPAVDIFRTLLAETNTLFGVTSLLIDDPDWDFFSVVFPSLGRLLQLKSHLAGVLEPDDWSRALSACYEQLDLVLGHLIRQAGPGTLVILVSADGTDGPFVLMSGEGGIPALRPSAGARLLDVAPTVCSVLCGSAPPWLEGSSWATNTARPGDSPDWTSIESSQSNDSSTRAMSHTPSEEAHPSTAHLLDLGYTDPLWQRQLEALQTVEKETGRNLVASLLEDGLVDEAIEEMKALIERFPQSASLRAFRAEVQARFGGAAQTNHDLEHLTENGHESARLYQVRGILALRERRARDAADFFHIAERLQPLLIGVHASQGEALRRSGDFAAARAAYDRGLDRYPHDAALLDGRVTCLLAHGAAEEAADAALTALAAHPTAWRLHYHLALALVALGHTAEAEAALQASLRCRPGNAAACYWLARLAEQSARPTEAADFRANGLAILKERRSSPLRAGA